MNRYATLLVLPVAVAACGRLPLILDGGDTDVGTGVGIDATSPDAAPDTRDDAPSRTPRNHRPIGVACPHDRGPSTLDPTVALKCAADPNLASLVDCLSDADCTAGINGECVLHPAPFACAIGCSYDGCFDDTECMGTAPCICRASAASPDANVCLTKSECRIDADCGAGGFCSPSLLTNLCICPSPALCPPGSSKCTAGGVEVPCACGDACGHGYFCHTPGDACVDDADCSAGTCTFDTVTRNWHCVTCLPVV